MASRMKSILLKTTKVAGIFALVLYLAVLATFQVSKRSYVSSLNEMSKLHVSEYGSVQYALIGDGPIVMTLHGTPGGFDQMLTLWSPLVEAGYSVLAVSRAGYLDSSLSSDQTLEREADALNSLVEFLGVNHVALIGSSGGGPLAFVTAARHPDSFWAFVAHAAVAKARDDVWPARDSTLLDTLFGDSFSEWTMLKIVEMSPEQLLWPEAPDSYRRIVADPVKMAVLSEMLWSGMGFPLGNRRAGWNYDSSVFETLTLDNMDRITAPTLFLYGADDENTPFEDAEAIAAQISNHEVLLHPGDHFAMISDPDLFFPGLIDFLNRTDPNKADSAMPPTEN